MITSSKIQTNFHELSQFPKVHGRILKQATSTVRKNIKCVKCTFETERSGNMFSSRMNCSLRRESVKYIYIVYSHTHTHTLSTQYVRLCMEVEGKGGAVCSNKTNLSRCVYVWRQTSNDNKNSASWDHHRSTNLTRISID